VTLQAASQLLLLLLLLCRLMPNTHTHTYSVTAFIHSLTDVVVVALAD